MKKRIISVALVVCLLFAMIPAASAAEAEAEDLDLWSWMLRNAANAADNAPIIKAIEFVSGLDLSSYVYKAYGFASSQICRESTDGLHEAIPSSISISYSSAIDGIVGTAYYTAQCKNCHKAFVSDSNRLSSAYESYLDSLDFTGHGIDASGNSFYTWQPSVSDLATTSTSGDDSLTRLGIFKVNGSSSNTVNLRLPVLPDSTRYYNNAMSNQTFYLHFGNYSWLEEFSGSYYNLSDSAQIHFTAPFSAVYDLLLTPAYTFNGLCSTGTNVSTAMTIRGTTNYLPSSFSYSKVSGDTISLYADSNFSSIYSVASTVLAASGIIVRYWPSIFSSFQFPCFKITHAIGDFRTDNSINIGTIDNSVVNLYDQTFVTPSGVVQPFESFWFSGDSYHVQYTDSDGISQDVQIDFNLDGISVTMPDGSTSKTDYTGPVFPPSVDGIETNTWLERIYNRLGDIFDKIGPGSGGGSDVDIDIDLPGSSDGSHSLWDILKDLLSPLTKLLSFLVGTVFDFLGEITDFFRALGSNDYFGIFDDSNFLQYEWSGDI